MYQAMIMGKKIRLTNRDYRSLKKRWAKYNFDWNGGNQGWEIKGECSLCGSRSLSLGCEPCPLYAFDTPDNQGCLCLIRKILGRHTEQKVFILGKALDYRLIFFAKRNTMIKYMEKIQAILATFKKA